MSLECRENERNNQPLICACTFVYVTVLVHIVQYVNVFSMRQHIAYAYRAICYRLSVRRVCHRKTVEVKIMKFSPYSSPILLVFAG